MSYRESDPILSTNDYGAPFDGNLHRETTNSEPGDYNINYTNEPKKSVYSLKFWFSKLLYIITGVVILVTLGIIVGILIFMSARPQKEKNLGYDFDHMFNSSFGVRQWDVSWVNVQDDDQYVGYFDESASQEFQTRFTIVEGKKVTITEDDGPQCSLRLFSTKEQDGRIVIGKDDLKSKNIACGTPYQTDSSVKFIAFKTAPEHVFRHSTKGYYVIWDVEKAKWINLSEVQKQLTLTMCSATRAYWVGEDNNLYMFNPEKNEHIQITDDGEKELRFNGISDWVYEEDVWGTDVLFEVSPSCDHIAFLHLNDENVEEFYYTAYDPASPFSKPLYIRYPKPGRAIPEVTIKVASCTDEECDIVYNRDLKTSPEAGGWVFQLVWASATRLLFGNTDRHQTQLFTYEWNIGDAADRPISRFVAQESDVSWVQYPRSAVPIDEFSYVEIKPNKDYYHLRLCTFTKDAPCTFTFLTAGNFNVIDIIAVREKRIFFTATGAFEDEALQNLGSTTQFVYEVQADGSKPPVLLPGQDDSKLAHYSASIAASGNTYSLFYEGPEIPETYLVTRAENESKVTVKESNEVLRGLYTDEKFDIPTSEVSNIELNGETMDLLLVKPKDFNSNQAHPVLLYFYGGPGSKLVTQEFAAQHNAFSLYMASRGFVVATLDNRGTGRKTASFLQTTYLHLGVKEAEDQIALKEALSKESWANEDNIMLWGWSFGGYLTLKTSSDPVYETTTPFRAATSVAPVTDWSYYNAAYTERFMQVPQTNPDGYKDTSVIQNILPSTFNGTRLFLNHGTSDDNVHSLNTMNLVLKLQNKEIPFDLMLYPNKDHSISGLSTRRFLYNKISKHFLSSLKE